MEQNIPLAIVLQAIGSFCFATSAYLQHHAVGQEINGDREVSGIAFGALWETIKSPKWILGLLAMGVSLGLQVLALNLAPVSVVQPVGLLAFPWSIAIQAWAAHRRPPRNVIVAAGVTAGATFALTVITGIFAAPRADLDQTRVFLGALVIYLCSMALGWMGARGPQQTRCLFWASGGAFFYGLEAALAKSLLEFAKKYEGWSHNPSFWSILIALLIGSATAGWMVQQGYATGPAEVVVAAMTITSPFVAVLFGIAVLGEGARLTGIVPWVIFILGLVAVGGVVALTLMHPSLDVDAEPSASTPAMRSADAAGADPRSTEQPEWGPDAPPV